jgi:hypothetical protein
MSLRRFLAFWRSIMSSCTSTYRFSHGISYDAKVVMIADDDI